MTPKILLVDDKADNLESLKLGFDRLPYEVESAVGGKEAITRIQDASPPYDVVITDLKMPDHDGMEVMRAARDFHPETAVILLTAFGTVDTAVEALKEGAHHYLTKPVHLDELRIEVKKAIERQELIETNQQLQSALDKKFGFEGIIGRSAPIVRVFDQVRQIADTRATVLLTGESGTGKELFSRAIHQQSSRRKKPFLPVHCAALAESLLESELFGHEKGSFTGALARKAGRFELANGGTIFLDEVGEIPLSVQVKLLRVLETKEFMRVGGIEPVKVDVRVVAATNRDLEKEVEEGNFREDLYYRLKVINLKLPPLRDRRDDIPVLVNQFVKELAEEHGRAVPEISSGAMERMTGYDWPGNVRQLRNVLESSILFNKSGVLEPRDLPASVVGSESAIAGGNMFDPAQLITLEEMENRMIVSTLEHADNNRTRAAELLGISRRTLQRKLKDLGMERKSNESDEASESEEELEPVEASAQ